MGRSPFCFLLYETNAKISLEKYLFQEKAMISLLLLNKSLLHTHTHIMFFVVKH